MDKVILVKWLESKLLDRVTPFSPPMMVVKKAQGGIIIPLTLINMTLDGLETEFLQVLGYSDIAKGNNKHKVYYR